MGEWITERELYARHFFHKKTFYKESTSQINKRNFNGGSVLLGEGEIGAFSAEHQSQM